MGNSGGDAENNRIPNAKKPLPAWLVICGQGLCDGS